MDNIFMIVLILAILAIPVFFVLGVSKREKGYFKKVMIAVIVAVISFFGMGIFGESSDDDSVVETITETEPLPEQEPPEEVTEDKEIIVEEENNEIEEEQTQYGLNEWWEVTDQWRLKIDSVSFTDKRNEFSNQNPKEVVVIQYTYENLGYEGETQDLFMTPDNVIDGDGKVVESYPAGENTRPKETPIGAMTEGAEVSYGLTTGEGELKIYFEKYDDDQNKQTARFAIPLADQ